MDPCNQFFDGAEMVVLYLDMGLEGGEVQVALPQSYLEDRADQQSGLRHGSLLLRMMVGSALPVSREQARRLTATQSAAHLTLLIGDFADLEKVIANLTAAAVPARNAVTRTPSDFGLSRLFAGDGDQSTLIYTAVNPSGELSAVLECRAAAGKSNQSCTHYFRTHAIDAVVDYASKLLPQWLQIQTQIDRFLSCATNGFE
ncbi:hypothetical protein K3556_14085 [Aliiroseovarius sp. M344]|uniref:hypothetical protein n=1 Tax=Aliiroseovarius sp. M344 TaxID=2867010 RepID=UPI0021AD8D73|nr:hypothetical protein [Aliiroseovarius sp. M344]UWQ14035.1 hypothetical protein K3556_14085 [Aliiroseovarius sp. M344]